MIHSVIAPLYSAPPFNARLMVYEAAPRWFFLTWEFDKLPPLKGLEAYFIPMVAGPWKRRDLAETALAIYEEERA